MMMVRWPLQLPKASAYICVAEDDSGSTTSAEDEMMGLTQTFSSFGAPSVEREDHMEEDDNAVAVIDNAKPRDLMSIPLATLRTLLACLDDTYVANPRRVPYFTANQLLDVESDRSLVFIQVAQLLAHQLPLQLEPSELFENISSLDCFLFEPYLPSFEDPLGLIFLSLFPRGEACDLQTCATLSENLSVSAAASKPILRPGTRPLSTGGQASQKESSFSIPPSRMLVQRADNLMEISSAALKFWEELGLAPCSGPKNVRAFCVFPMSQMIQRAAENFLQTISGTYQSFRLGSHSVGDELDEFSDGLVPVKFEGSSMEDNMKRIDEVCEQLGMSTVGYIRDGCANSQNRRTAVESIGLSRIRCRLYCQSVR